MFLAQETQHDEDFHLKPTSTAGVLDTSKWPLLLKVHIRYLFNDIMILLLVCLDVTGIFLATGLWWIMMYKCFISPF